MCLIFVFVLYMADLAAQYGVSLHAYADDTQLHLLLQRNRVIRVIR